MELSTETSLSLDSNSGSSWIDGWIWSEVSGLFGALMLRRCIRCVWLVVGE